MADGRRLGAAAGGGVNPCKVDGVRELSLSFLYAFSTDSYFVILYTPAS